MGEAIESMLGLLLIPLVKLNKLPGSLIDPNVLLDDFYGT